MTSLFFLVVSVLLSYIDHDEMNTAERVTRAVMGLVLLVVVFFFFLLLLSFCCVLFLVFVVFFFFLAVVAIRDWSPSRGLGVVYKILLYRTRRDEHRGARDACSDGHGLAGGDIAGTNLVAGADRSAHGGGPLCRLHRDHCERPVPSTGALGTGKSG